MLKTKTSDHIIEKEMLNIKDLKLQIDNLAGRIANQEAHISYEDDLLPVLDKIWDYLVDLEPGQEKDELKQFAKSARKVSQDVLRLQNLRKATSQVKNELIKSHTLNQNHLNKWIKQGWWSTYKTTPSPQDLQAMKELGLELGKPLNDRSPGIEVAISEVGATCDCGFTDSDGYPYLILKGCHDVRGQGHEWVSNFCVHCIDLESYFANTPEH